MNGVGEIKIAYFGGEPIGVPVLEELEAAGIVPNLVITNPDRPVGRKQILNAPPVKQWAQEKDIEVWQPESVKDRESVEERLDGFDLFIVVAYTKILPMWLIDLPKYKTINVHPSLLPLLRGPSPIRSAILEDMKETGVSIMQMDAEMDHGPLIAQKQLVIAPENWPLKGTELDEGLGRLGGALLASVLPDWVAGTITPKEQDHEKATYCKKISKEDGRLHIDPCALPRGEEAYEAFLKICAYDTWPGTFFIHEGKRIKITQAHLALDSSLMIKKVVPEGKKEMDFTQWLR